VTAQRLEEWLEAAAHQAAQDRTIRPPVSSWAIAS
jgi:hypothetical protein